MTALTILGLTALAAALIPLFFSWRWCALTSFAGMCLCAAGNAGVARPAMLVFWGIAAAIATGINLALPKAVATSRTGMGYVAGGALLGTLTGYLLGMGALVICDVTGTVLGAMAFSRTPAGRHLDFPSSKFVQYICAKGLPAIVTMAIAAFSVIVITL